MAVRAPFNFARIPRKVWYPAWGDLVCHDVPFKDGWSGHIELEIEAKTELLIGGPRRAATDQKEGEVWPVQLPDGTYAIPPSSLQGMTRSILETAFFGKLGPWVDDRRFGVRDISGSATGKLIYGERMNRIEQGVIYPRSKAAWLKKDMDGVVRWLPCSMARIDHADLVKLSPARDHNRLLNLLSRKAPYHDRKKESESKEAPARYAAFRDSEELSALEVGATFADQSIQNHSCGKIAYEKYASSGPVKCTIVITGKPSGAEKFDKDLNELVPVNSTKHMEFLFHTPSRTEAAAQAQDWKQLPEDVWRDFRLIHEPPKGSGQKENPNWQYWKPEFEKGQPVPIFYLERVDAANVPLCGTIAAMGTAFMFKLAQTSSTHQLLENSTADHVSPKSKLDLASLIFGTIAGEDGKPGFKHSLKRRASFEWAIPVDGTQPQCVSAQYVESENQAHSHAYAPQQPADATVLLSPKPSYYPIYVQQRSVTGNSPYASYTPVSGAPKPELTGTKVWPATGQSLFNQMPRAPTLSGNTRGGRTNSKATQVHLNSLEKGARFTTGLHIHNLRTIEIQALLWALTFGDSRAIGEPNEPVNFHHRIGMGKPYGLGEIAIRVTGSKLKANDPENDSELDLRMCLKDCSNAFDAVLGFESTWQETLQVKALLAAAQPECERQLGYMTLPDYLQNRTAGNALRPLVDDHNSTPTNGAQNNPRPQLRSSPQRNIPMEQGCRVKREDGMEGELGLCTFGMWTVEWDDGSSGPAPTNSFVVLSPPE